MVKPYHVPPSCGESDADESRPRPKLLSQRDLARVEARELVTQALQVSDAPQVARRIGCSVELVYGWTYGRSVPNLEHLLRAPRAFALRLLVLAREQIDAAQVLRRDPQEALYLATLALGGLLVDLTKTSLDRQSPEQLDETEERAGRLEEEAGAIRRAAAEEKRRRAERAEREAG